MKTELGQKEKKREKETVLTTTHMLTTNVCDYVIIFSRYMRHKEATDILFTAIGLADRVLQTSKRWRGAEEEA